jgi:hypothetical protein
MIERANRAAIYERRRQTVANMMKLRAKAIRVKHAEQNPAR